jgi:hypothetical protein
MAWAFWKDKTGTVRSFMAGISLSPVRSACRPSVSASRPQGFRWATTKNHTGKTERGKQKPH